MRSRVSGPNGLVTVRFDPWLTSAEEVYRPVPTVVDLMSWSRIKGIIAGERSK